MSVKIFDLSNVSMRWKTVAVMLTVAGVSVLLEGAGLLRHTRTTFEREIVQDLSVVGDLIGHHGAAAVASNDRRTAADILTALRRDERVIAGAFYDRDGKMVADYYRTDADRSLLPASVPVGRAPVFTADSVTVARPIETDARFVGELHLVADMRDWKQALLRFLAVLALLFAGVLVVGFVVSMGLQRLVTGRVDELARLMRRVVKERDYGLRAVKRGNDEIGQLVDGFNEMLAEIGSRRAQAETSQRLLRARVAELDAEITERKRVEAELRRSRQQVQSFIENANVGLNRIGPDGTILWANRYEPVILGYSLEEYVGRNVADFYADPDVAADVLARLRRSETFENYEVRLRAKDGSIRYGLVNSTIHRENDEVVHMHCFTHDISERKCAESALRASEARYRTLVAATASVVFATDATGNVTGRLPSWEDYTGQSWDEYGGMGWLAKVHPDDHQGLRNAFALGQEDARSFDAEVRVWHARTQRYRYCVHRAVPLARNDGVIQEWIGTLMDVDDRKRAEEHFRLAVESAPNAMVMIDERGKIVLVNRRLLALFGYTRDELIGKPGAWLLPERLHKSERALGGHGSNPLPERTAASCELRVRHKDGREIPVEIGLSPMNTEEGTFSLASVNDISERRRAEQDLKRYTEELQRSNRELGQFAYVASHDLQEPMRAISGCVQLLAQRYRDKLDARAHELIEHTVSGAARMQALINDLLSYSRVSSRARPFEVCDIHHPIRQALANLEFAIQESHAKVTVAGMPLASVDPTQFTQLFQNLIGNAIKFRAERVPEIHVGAEPRSGNYLFWVKDNGIGVEPQCADRIFGVFQRLHGRAKYPGNGIGLAICRKIVERHDGRIWVESIPGIGSTFYFTLPLKSVHNVEAASERYSNPQR
ncbi:MAG: PAS domain S-box protein [Sulfurifustaceae bacterium]